MPKIIPENLRNNKAYAQAVMEALNASGLLAALNAFANPQAFVEKMNAEMGNLDPAKKQEYQQIIDMLFQAKNMQSLYQNNPQAQFGPVEFGGMSACIDRIQDFKDFQEEIKELKNQEDISSLPENHVLNQMEAVSQAVSTFNALLPVSLAKQSHELTQGLITQLTAQKKTADEAMMPLTEAWNRLNIQSEGRTLNAESDSQLLEKRYKESAAELKRYQTEGKQELKQAADEITLLEDEVQKDEQELKATEEEYKRNPNWLENAKKSKDNEIADIQAKIEAAKKPKSGEEQNLYQEMDKIKDSIERLSPGWQYATALRRLKELPGTIDLYEKQVAFVQEQVDQKEAAYQAAVNELEERIRVRDEAQNDPAFLAKKEELERAIKENDAQTADCTTRLNDKKQELNDRKDELSQIDKDNEKQFAHDLSEQELEEMVSSLQEEVTAIQKEEKQLKNIGKITAGDLRTLEREHNEKIDGLGERVNRARSHVDWRGKDLEEQKTYQEKNKRELEDARKSYSDYQKLALKVPNDWLTRYGFEPLTQIPTLEEATEALKKVEVKIQAEIDRNKKDPLEKVRAKNPNEYIKLMNEKIQTLKQEKQDLKDPEEALNRKRNALSQKKDLLASRKQELTDKTATHEKNLLSAGKNMVVLNKAVEKHNEICDVRENLTQMSAAVYKNIKQATEYKYMPYQGVTEQLSVFFNHLDDKKRFLHRDSDEFKNMKEALKAVLEDKFTKMRCFNVADSYDAEGLSSMQQKLQRLKDSAEAYIAAKGDMGPKPTQMRKQRLEDAQQLLKLSSLYLQKDPRALKQMAGQNEAMVNNITMRPMKKIESLDVSSLIPKEAADFFKPKAPEAPVNQAPVNQAARDHSEIQAPVKENPQLNLH